MKAGDRVYRYVYAGTRETLSGRIDDADPQPLTVVRVNRKTVTVRTDAGDTLRIPPEQIEGRWEAGV